MTVCFRVTIVIAALLHAPLAFAENGPLLGAAGPEKGDAVITAGGGLVFNVPTGSLSARLGTGAGWHLGADYDLIGLLGHSFGLRLGGGGFVGEDVAMGAALSTAIGSLQLAEVAGVDFANLDFGNDWISSLDFVVSWTRPERAHITATFGIQITLADYEFTSFTATEYLFEPALRGVTASIQGEWELEEVEHFFIRLQGLVPLHTDVTPIGFLPTVSAGVAWRIQ
jgi:hypothetical protein